MAKTAKPIIELFRKATWRKQVAAAIRRTIPPKVVACLKSLPGEKMYEDTMRYMENAYDECGACFDAEARDCLTEAVLRPFGFVRGYHGCRPMSYETYRTDGLLALTRERLALMAFELFEGTLTLESLQRRAEWADLNTRLGYIYFCAYGDDLIEDCGHYTIYGAEALNCLWNCSDPKELCLFHESQRRARSKGIPTILICDIPLRWLSTGSRAELANAMVTWHLQLVSEKPDDCERDRNWSWTLKRDLPASYIKGHIHPQRIRDPLNFQTLYENPHTECDGCKPPRPIPSGRRKAISLRA